MTDGFTRDGYRTLLSGFAERGYEVVSFDDAVADRRHLILRHDLDMSIQAALPIAEIEHALGVRAHYFVLLGTEMYNPWSEAGRRDLTRLRALGHRIGLHLDAALYPDPAALERGAEAECAALEAVIDAPVTMISLHRPAPHLQGSPAPLAGRPHSYQPRFFTDMGYCSDSRGGWHHGHPFDHAAVAAGRALQLLTHPIWWHANTPADPVTRLDAFRRTRDAVLADALAANCEPYANRTESGKP